VCTLDATPRPTVRHPHPPRSRLRTFPPDVVLLVLYIGALFAVIAACSAIAFTGRYRGGSSSMSRIRYTAVWPAAIVKALLLVGFEIGDGFQAGGMLNGIRTRAERGTATVGDQDEGDPAVVLRRSGRA
jgi:hypothetical protein